MANRISLGDILLEERLIAPEQLNQAHRAAERLGTPLVMILLEQGIIDEKSLYDALRKRLGLKVFILNQTPVDLDAVREVPFEEANRYRILPLQFFQKDDKRILRVAMVNPLDFQAIEDIEFTTGAFVDPIIVRDSHLTEALRNYYRGMVTKIMQRVPKFSPKESAAKASPLNRMPFGGNLDETTFHTKRMDHVQKIATLNQKVDALVSLLVHKGIVTLDEYEEQLRALVCVDKENP